MYTLEVRKSVKGAYSDVDLEKNEAVIKFATYNTPDRDGDIANKGMFTKSWQEFKDVRLFKNHDQNVAPGKIIKMWDDNNHAYARVKFGRSTLGQDTLMDIQDEIITDASYLFVPLKDKPIAKGGRSYSEVFHKEVSVLTHWGAHPESKIAAVKKSAGALLESEVLKELSSNELAFLETFINTSNAQLIDLANFAARIPRDSDLYTWINDVIASHSGTISNFKYRVRWYAPVQKSESDALAHLEKLKSAIHSSKSSDEHIQELMKECSALENILSEQPGSTLSSESTQEQQKGQSNDGALQIELLNLQMLLD